MSALDATSTPRVGSSTMSTFGSRTSHLASSTFCWFPPERSRTTRRVSGSRSAAAPRTVARRTAMSASDMMPRCVNRWRSAAPTLAATVKSRNRPLSLRSSGSIEMPAAMESAGFRGTSSCPSMSTRPETMGRAPKIASHASVRPAPTSPARHTISPFRTENDADGNGWCHEVDDLERDRGILRHAPGSGSNESSRPTISRMSRPGSPPAPQGHP